MDQYRPGPGPAGYPRHPLAKVREPVRGRGSGLDGAVRDEVMDRETLAANLMLKLRSCIPRPSSCAISLPPPGADGYELLETAAKKRGFLVSRGEYDLERMAAVLLDEFRDGKLAGSVWNGGNGGGPWTCGRLSAVSGPRAMG